MIKNHHKTQLTNLRGEYQGSGSNQNAKRENPAQPAYQTLIPFPVEQVRYRHFYSYPPNQGSGPSSSRQHMRYPTSHRPRFPRVVTTSLLRLGHLSRIKLGSSLLIIFSLTQETKCMSVDLPLASERPSISGIV